MTERAAERIARRYLSLAELLLPGRITDFYLVGSLALGRWQRARCSTAGCPCPAP
jgi:hypothetical protein